jgi:hypothetical protein
MVFRRDVLLEGGGFDPTYGMNTEAMAGDESELTLRLLRRGRTLVFTPDMRVYHPTKTPAERLASRRTYGHAMGRALRHHRRGTTVARYLLELAQVAGAAAAHRNVARLREAAQQARGFMSGLVTSRTWLSPPEVLELAPPQIRELIDAADVQPLPAPDRPRPHLLYRVEEGRILHAYGWPAPSLFSALEARQVIRSGSDLAGIPQVHALAHGLDSIWLLEDRLPGEHPAARNARSWFDSVASWALALAGPPGPALHTTPDWEAWTDAALRISPPDLRGDLSHALEAVADLPAVRVHGDFSRKNVLIHDGQVGAADWENCALLGLPGRDLLFLAVGAQGDRPDADVIVRLARGDDPPFGQLIGPLDRLGVSRDLIRPALLTILAGWAADEDRRLRELGATARSRDYLALLARCAEALRSRR